MLCWERSRPGTHLDVTLTRTIHVNIARDHTRTHLCFPWQQHAQTSGLPPLEPRASREQLEEHDNEIKVTQPPKHPRSQVKHPQDLKDLLPISLCQRSNVHALTGQRY